MLFRSFFTATPKHHTNPNANGMNNVSIYGDVIHNVRAQHLIETGCIIPPQIDTYKVDITRDKRTAAEADRNMIVDILDTLEGNPKVLVAAPSTKVMWNMLTNSDILRELEERGFGILHITSKHGAYVNRTKVNREKFFDTLTEWGKDKSKKFVLLHYSINLVIRNAANQEIAVAKNNIEERQQGTMSLMPSGLLEALPEREAFELLKFLTTETK